MPRITIPINDDLMDELDASSMCRSSFASTTDAASDRPQDFLVRVNDRGCSKLDRGNGGGEDGPYSQHVNACTQDEARNSSV